MKKQGFRLNSLLSNVVKAFLITVFTLIFSVILSAQNSGETQKFQTREIRLDNCIQMFGQDQFIIKTDDEFQSAIRKDASRDHCLANLEKIDFEKNSLLGININSGYCRIPVGLEHEFVKDEKNKKYTLKISYIDPNGSVCRALSRYNLWVLVPKIPNGFDVEFEITPEPSKLT